MDLTPDDVRTPRFSGTRHVYDRREVDLFLGKIAHALEARDSELDSLRRRLESLQVGLEVAKRRADAYGADSMDLESARRDAEDVRIDALYDAARAVRHAEQEVSRIAATSPERMPERDTRGKIEEQSTPGETSVGAQASASAWRTELERLSQAAEVMVSAEEEARRLTQVAAAAAAEAREMRARDETGSRRRLDDELAEARVEGQREVERLIAGGKVEAARLLEHARRDADSASKHAEREVQALERRVRQIRSSLRELESRFRSMTATTLAEFAMLGDLVELDLRGVEHLAATEDAEAAEGSGEGRVRPSAGEPEERGFYERRLAGLRSRLEATQPDRFDTGDDSGE